MVDIHTHHLEKKNCQNDIVLLNRLLAEGLPEDPQQPFSMGLHPWYIDQHPEWATELPMVFQKIAETHPQKPKWAIGECGLDKNTAYSLDLQTSVLNLHYEWALKLQKPLIIHCVGAFNALIHWKKTHKTVLPMLVHGFEKKLPLLNDLLKAGFYVSFGAALCQNRPTLHQAFRQMPMDRLFLETDDQEDYTIAQVYEAAAMLKNIDLDTLKNQINTNFQAFFECKTRL